MNARIIDHPQFSLLVGVVFFMLMAMVPTGLELSGVSGGGIAQLDVLNKIGIYAVLALSLNIILGQTGLFNMGHAAFFAVGAYTTAILNTMYQWPVFSTMPAAGFLAALFAFLVVMPIIHLRGDYLLVVTIGIVEIVRIALMNNIFGITGGPNGIYGIARPALFGLVFSSVKLQYYLIWSFTGISLFLFYLLEHSRIGRAFNYIKHDDLAAAGCGINVARYKLMAFVLGAFWAGMAGTLYAANIRTIEPMSFNFYESVILFAIVILGGSGSNAGVILGAFLLVGLQDLFRGFDSARMLFFGAAMCAMMVFRPQGLLPPRRRRYNAWQLVGKFASAIRRSYPCDEDKRNDR
ncbi:branched-chain amino acid ABC transporter permease [Desulfosarcina sp. OttesenSCG-928-A07]|nr:branched-chain amino acid ABC transporter permease [Desulfosarcina sp. OttesenSCG-928-A07]